MEEKFYLRHVSVKIKVHLVFKIIEYL